MNRATENSNLLAKEWMKRRNHHESQTEPVQKSYGASSGWAVVMILMGLFAVILPFAPGIAVSVLISWLIVLCGLAHLALALWAEMREDSCGEC